MPKKVINMLMKYFSACIIDLKWFEGQKSKKIRDIRKLDLRHATLF